METFLVAEPGSTKHANWIEPIKNVGRLNCCKGNLFVHVYCKIITALKIYPGSYNTQNSILPLRIGPEGTVLELIISNLDIINIIKKLRLPNLSY